MPGQLKLGKRPGPAAAPNPFGVAAVPDPFGGPAVPDPFGGPNPFRTPAGRKMSVDDDDDDDDDASVVEDPPSPRVRVVRGASALARPVNPQTPGGQSAANVMMTTFDGVLAAMNRLDSYIAYFVPTPDEVTMIMKCSEKASCMRPQDIFPQDA